MTAEDLIKILQAFDPKTEVYFGCGNEENLYIETIPISKIDQGFVTHKSNRIEFYDTLPADRVDINHPSLVLPAIRLV